MNTQPNLVYDTPSSAEDFNGNVTKVSILSRLFIEGCVTFDELNILAEDNNLITILNQIHKK